jgi:hypothetical protein
MNGSPAFTRSTRAARARRQRIEERTIDTDNLRTEAKDEDLGLPP